MNTVTSKIIFSQQGNMRNIATFVKWFLRIAVITQLVFAGCTAYFNTYYNAETAFKQAQKSHLEVMAQYPDSLVVTPPSDAERNYDRTIEKATKVIEIFPKKPKWHDDAIFLMGKAHFYKKEPSKAIRRFRQLEQEFPESSHIPESYLYMAKSYIENENLDKAEEVCITAEKRFPELNKDNQITLLLIAIAIRRDGKSQAIQLLEKMRGSIKSEKLRINLTLQTAELYIQLQKYDNAIALLEDAPRRKKNPLQMYRLDRALLTCYTAVDSLEKANTFVTSMIGNRLYISHMDEMLYQQGLILHSLGRYDDAIKVFKEITAGIDTATIRQDTSTYKAKALYQLALLYQKEKEDYPKAQMYFDLAAKTKDTTTLREAQKRMSAFERLKFLREDTKLDDSLPGHRLFSIGELFRFELYEPDSAYFQFIDVATDSATDTAIIPKALCQAARIARGEISDTTKSDSLFKVIIKRYPVSEYAKIAQEELDIPLTVQTREDSAYAAYQHAEKLYYKENRIKESIQAFFGIAKQYEDLPIAPKSLFAAAWFSDNILFKNKTARMLYEKICDQYPESIYCAQQAKPRLKIVIDTLAKLEQLRKENIAKDAATSTSEKHNDEKTSSIATDMDDDELLTPEEIENKTADPQKGTSTNGEKERNVPFYKPPETPDKQR
jgi:tetratricopeptide (TPR) repeat protein